MKSRKDKIFSSEECQVPFSQRCDLIFNCKVVCTLQHTPEGCNRQPYVPCRSGGNGGLQTPTSPFSSPTEVLKLKERRVLIFLLIRNKKRELLKRKILFIENI